MNLWGVEIVGDYDFILTIIYWLMILFFARRKVRKNIEEKPYYKYYMIGLNLKLVACVSLCVIFIWAYQGGDTINYFRDAKIMSQILVRDPGLFMDLFWGGIEFEFEYFGDIKGLGLQYFMYHRDAQTFFVVRLMSLFVFLSFNNFFAASILVTYVCYKGVWRLFEAFMEIFPGYERVCAISVFFVPSVVFWGSGMLKDPVTFSATGFLIWSMNNLIRGRDKWKNILRIVLMSYMILSIKAYIFFALFPSILLWVSLESTKNIESRFLKRLTAPLIVGLAVIFAYTILNSMGDTLGRYSLDGVLEHAALVQDDLKKEYYGGHRFDIGPFEPTFLGVMSKAPIAIGTTIFGPFIWQARNIFVVMAALESMAALFLTIRFILSGGIFRFPQEHRPFLIFSLVFILFFSFSVGLTAANFGALMRYKIPMLPFFSVFTLVLSRRREPRTREPRFARLNEDEPSVEAASS